MLAKSIALSRFLALRFFLKKNQYCACEQYGLVSFPGLWFFFNIYICKEAGGGTGALFYHIYICILQMQNRYDLRGRREADGDTGARDTLELSR